MSWDLTKYLRRLFWKYPTGTSSLRETITLGNNYWKMTLKAFPRSYFLIDRYIMVIWTLFRYEKKTSKKSQTLSFLVMRSDGTVTQRIIGTSFQPSLFESRWKRSPPTKKTKIFGPKNVDMYEAFLGLINRRVVREWGPSSMRLDGQNT